MSTHTPQVTAPGHDDPVQPDGPVGQAEGTHGAQPSVPLLEATDVTKAFPGVLALDRAQLTLMPGSVHALVGENGAGKSTLMKILAGIYQPDSGALRMDGRPLRLPSPWHAQRAGIAVIHQELGLAPDLTVEQNIFLGREPRAGRGIGLSSRRLRAACNDLLARTGLDLRADARVGDLTVAGQQMVEIAKALSYDARVLIMDEPTTALTERETETLLRVMADFVTPRTGIIYISHRMEEIKRVADTITVMRDGRWVSTTPAAELSTDTMIERMVGRRITSHQRPQPVSPDAPVRLRVTGLCTADLLREVSLEVRAGEILGLAGLVGAGRTQTARALVGADPRTAGRIEVDGREVRISSPRDAVAHSIAYLSEDRKRYGLLLDKSLVDNTALASYRQWAHGIVVDDSRAAQVTDTFIQRLRIKTPSRWQEVANLSGGNQQKVVIAKWLARDCDILIVDEPTRGIDVGAKEEIYQLLTDLAGQGKAIIVISSEIPELLRLAQRIVVMREGRVTGVLDNAEATQVSIMQRATGQVTALTSATVTTQPGTAIKENA